MGRDFRKFKSSIISQGEMDRQASLLPGQPSISFSLLAQRFSGLNLQQNHLEVVKTQNTKFAFLTSLLGDADAIGQGTTLTAPLPWAWSKSDLMFSLWEGERACQCVRVKI